MPLREKVNTIVYMNQGNPHTHAWWKDHSDAHQQRVLLSTQRAVQRERNIAGWRRNLVIGAFLVLAVPTILQWVAAL